MGTLVYSAGSGLSPYRVVYGSEIDLLGGPIDVTTNIEAGYKAWIEEAGFIVISFNLDGGVLGTQPTIRFGITGILDKYKTATTTTLLTDLSKRARYTTLSADDGETSFTAGMTVSGVISGGGGSESYKGKPYWVIRVLAN